MKNGLVTIEEIVKDPATPEWAHQVIELAQKEVDPVDAAVTLQVIAIAFQLRMDEMLRAARKSLVLVLLLPMLIACGRSDAPASIAPEFQPAVDEFVEAAKARGVEVDMRGIAIEFGTPGEGHVGICRHGGRIEVDRKAWERDEDRDPLWHRANRLLIFHELGHCVYGMGHDDEMVGVRPASIMFHAPADVAPFFFDATAEAYFDHFFGGVK